MKVEGVKKEIREMNGHSKVALHWETGKDLYLHLIQPFLENITKGRWMPIPVLGDLLRKVDPLPGNSSYLGVPCKVVPLRLIPICID